MGQSDNLPIGPARRVRAARASALAVGLAAFAFAAAVPGCARAPAAAVSASSPLQAQALAAGDPALAAAYAARGWTPVWFQGAEARPEARSMIAALQGAAADGLDPQRYAPDALWSALAAARDAPSIARADIALTRAFARYVMDLHTPAPGAGLALTDPALQALYPTRAGVLEALARPGDLASSLDSLRRMNPIYVALRSDLAREGDPDRARLIRANLERARALPADPGPRYIVVNVAAQQLWMYQDGRPVGTMKVIVGKTTEPTPMMAGIIRFAVFHPYWNLPPDLTRERAQKVLTSGVSSFTRAHLQALSDWSDSAVPLDPDAIDWAAVASGRQELRVRQLPGPDNMMGQLKFMLPNRFGVYLHDTPNKAPFRSTAVRALSSGCVRLQDARALGRWLFGGQLPAVQGDDPEHRVDLPRPTPVFITYLTAAPAGRTIAIRHDLYGRDAPLIAALDRDQRDVQQASDAKTQVIKADGPAPAAGHAGPA